MRGGVQGVGKIEGGFAVLAVGGIAALISIWGPRAAETADSPTDSAQVRAEEAARSVNSRLIVSNLSFGSPAYRLTSEAMFGYFHTDVPKLSRTQDGRINSRVLANLQREGAAPQSIRVPRDASNFFNEAQLASIKTRLKLTPAQQPYWPPLESALRAIQWRRSEDKAARNTHKSLDLDGEQVQRLAAAATPLVMRLRADQKEEVRTLLHLMGMEQLASRF
jgi:hypothetical protein